LRRKGEIQRTSVVKAAEGLKKKRCHLKTMRAYKCEYCDGSHVGHGTPRESIMIGGLKITIGKEMQEL